jgi:hypothetical protein
MAAEKDPTRHRPDLFKAAQIVIGVLFLGALIFPFREIGLRGHNDFSAFYAGAKLAGTPDLYNHDVIRKIVQAGWPDSPEQEVFLRPPFYAMLLKPLAALPYRPALLVFTSVSIASFLWFVIRFSKESRDLAILAAFSIPMLLNVNGGADVPFLLPVIGGFILLSRRRRDFAAGLILALCAIKIHLFVFIPLLLIFKRRWRVLIGASTGTAVLTLIGGIGLIAPWLKVIFSPLITEMPVWKLSPAPNIHGLVTVLGGGATIEHLLIALVVIFFVCVCFGIDNFELLLAVSLICGMLVSYHNFTYDDVLLMPVLVLVTQFRALRALIGLALTPPVYLAAFAGGLLSTILPIMLFAFLGTVAWLFKAGNIKPVLLVATPQTASEELIS